MTTGRRLLGLGTMLLALLVVVAVVASQLVTAPYVLLKPGTAYDVLAEEGPGGGPMIRIEGHETHPTEGGLRMTTVAMYGGPGHEASWWEVTWSRLRGQDEIIPREQVFPAEVTEEEVDQHSSAQMEGSQSGASVVALRAAGVEVTEEVVVGEVLPDAAARGVLRTDDVILEAGGRSVEQPADVQQVVQAAEPGTKVPMRVRRDGRERTLEVPTGTAEGRTVVGVLLGARADSAVDVTVDAGAVGGPSAGMMLSLGIYDQLTEGPLTGGEDIAGTGTIDAEGQVGPIDGIRQKMIGARDSGADWFLAPDANCVEVVGRVPGGMEAFAVTDFSEARSTVEAIAAGDTAGLETCEQVLAEQPAPSASSAG